MRKFQLFIILSVIFFVTPALAQSEATTVSAPASTSPVVNVSVSDGGVRYASPAQVLQMRLEIYNASGELVFDSGLRQGSILDWNLTGASRALTDGSYLSIVTTQDFQGKFRQRLGSISLQAGQASLKRMSKAELTATQAKALAASGQAQKIDPSETSELTIMRETKERAATVAAHDGEDGQLTSTKGALTFRTGNVFSGAEREQMRITPDGRVGIGTDKPEAALDIAGEVRPRGGIRFADGTLLTSAGQVISGANTNSRNTTVTAASITNNITPSVAGTGTPGRLTKWVDSAGTLADSAFTESAGNLGIGTNAPVGKLHLVDSVGSVTTGDNTFRLESTGGTFGPSFRFKSAEGADFIMSATGSSNEGGAGAFRIYDNKAFTTRFFIAPTTGNIGLGTFAPSQRLEVAGNVKLSGAGSGIIFPDGTKMTTAASGGNGGSGTPSGTSIVAAINDAATAGVINDNRLSANLARRNLDNLWTGSNVFSLGLSANNAPVVNVGNPVNAGDAVNKSFFDTNAVRFVPGAEQLSVGDANGTAAMINLRGGSTCCSGPGGHTPAFFKVFQNGSFVATGNLGIGVSPFEGKGYRTSWHTYKGAFRSGYADNEWDDANTGFFSWAGGSNSTASGLYALAFGDTNFALSTSSIAFGSGNEVKGAAGFSAGAGNRVCDTYGVAFGNKAQSGGPLVNGKCDPDSFNITGLAAVAIGFNVTADKDHTTAMGKFASNNGFSGTFIWSDGLATASADTFRNTANNEFAARATGGFRFRTNLTGTTGCNLPAGSGVFNCTSSRTTKENFLLANGEDVLARLRKVPVSTWNYISEGRQVQHMGPMAEDFYKAFSLGTDERSIGVLDIAGVNLAAVKALEARTSELQQKSTEVDKLRAEMDALRVANASLEERLATLEKIVKAQAGEEKN